MHIEVVAPVEPQVMPGAVMEVGDLVDGFRYVAPRRREPEPAAYAPYDDWSEPLEPAPDRRRPVERAVIEPPPQPEPPRRDRWFGFDAPDRDYRSEREARRARREARAEDDYRRERPQERRREWYRDGRRESPPPRDYGPPPAPWN